MLPKQISFLFSKTCLAPLKKISISGLELLALVLRCLEFDMGNFHLSVIESFTLTDSQCVYSVRNKKTGITIR